MDAAGAAARFRALDAELAATSSRVAELEARVSLLEAENARLRRALASGGATGCAGERDPESDRLAAGSGGSKREAVEKPSKSVACDVIEVSDDEEVAAVGAQRGRSTEEGFVAAIPTPRKRAVRVVTGDSEDEDDAEAEGGGGSGKVNSVGLDDDDVSVAPRGRKRKAARVVTSDSEDEDVNGGELGSAKDDVDHREEGLRSSKKRGLCGIQICDSEDEDATKGVDVVTPKAASPAQMESGEDEDDMVPICQVLKKTRKETAGDDDDDEQAKGCSTPATRRSARLVKNQTKGGRSARRVLNFVKPKEHEGSEDDMEEDSDMADFINDEDSSENASDSVEESCDEPEESGTSVLDEQSSPGPEESDTDSEVDYADVMARIGRKKKAKDWKFEGDMLASFAEHPELCLKAVCALYRKQTHEEQLEKAALVHNKEGFNHIDATRGSHIAEFLMDGDLGPLKKTISNLEKFDACALRICRNMASRYSKQLFAIYQNKEDPYFHP